MVIRSSKPASCFLGIQPGHKHFRDLAESRQIHEIEGVLIYRFSSNLFFANAGVLQQDIEQELERRGNIKAVILDASGIGSMDITAADRIEILYKSLKEQGIRFYITEHIADLNEQMRKLGIGYLIEEGCVRRTIYIALKDMGIKRPYPLEGGVDNEERSASRKRVDNRMQEFVWAFGSDTKDQIERQIAQQIKQLKQNGDVENLLHGSWSHMEAFDEDEWLEHLEEHLKEIVNISRAFLDTNGAHQETSVEVEIPSKDGNLFEKRPDVTDVKKKWLDTLADLNVCSQKGLVEMFDGSIGAASVFMPHGGKYQKTETQAMVAKLPVLTGDCDTVSMMSYGFDPYLSSWSPYHGAVYAVTESVAKIVAAGGDYRKIRFTFQEYFRRMTEDPKRWSQPFAALLGAYAAQIGFGLPSIGGKDSMSGTFQDIDVPPTLVSFAVDMALEQDIITPELKKAGNKLVWLKIERDENDLPVYDAVMDQYGKFMEDIQSGKIVSAYALDRHGVAAAVSKMAFGNRMGAKIEHNVDKRDLFAPAFGDIIAEVEDGKVGELAITYTEIGEVTEEPVLAYGDVKIALADAQDAWTGTLEKVFATKSAADSDAKVEEKLFNTSDIHICSHKIGQPTVFIPVFPGTNCEYDSARAFERAGAKVITKVFRNLDAEDIRGSVDEFEKAIGQAQMIMFPGGFSAGDEPDGSAKFFATAFRNEKLKEAVMDLLNNRDGLALGICNGFQALIKLGLVPEGKIVEQNAKSPTLTTNRIGRHISKVAYTRIASNLSPWFNNVHVDDIFSIPVSHGEGRFVADEDVIQKLFENGQVATQYVDLNGDPTMNEEFNPNGSYHAIEGITSPDGRVLGKMAHSERRGDHVAINIYGEQDLKIFESGVKYFK